MANRDVALAFVSAFCSGDVPGIEELLTHDFSLTGPLATFDSRDEYVSCLNSDPPVPVSYEIISVLDSPKCVSVYYNYLRKSVSITIAQLFWIQNEKISRTILVFDRPRA